MFQVSRPDTMKIVGVVGASFCSKRIYVVAKRLGKLLATEGYAIVCGGLGGVMQAVCEGASAAGGITIGILPGKFSSDANPYVKIPIVTSMSHARNAIITRTAGIVVAVDGKYGTLSEIALTLAMNKKVISIETTWNIPGIIKAEKPEDAVKLVKKYLPIK